MTFTFFIIISDNAEAYDTEHGEKGCNVQETLHDALERQHDALEAANESEERYQEWRRKKLERENEEKIEVLNKAKDLRAILGDLQKNLHEFPADALEEILEQEAEERAELLEEQQGDLQKNLHEFPADALEEIERADLLEKLQEAKFAEQEKALDEALDRMERASNALKLGTKARWGF